MRNMTVDTAPLKMRAEMENLRGNEKNANAFSRFAALLAQVELEVCLGAYAGVCAKSPCWRPRGGFAAVLQRFCGGLARRRARRRRHSKRDFCAKRGLRGYFYLRVSRKRWPHFRGVRQGKKKRPLRAGRGASCAAEKLRAQFTGLLGGLCRLFAQTAAALRENALALCVGLGSRTFLAGFALCARRPLY